MRAVAMDSEADAVQGINANRISVIAIGIGAALMGVLYAIIRYQSSKIDELEHENKINDKLKEIRKDQDELIEVVFNDE